MNPKKFINHPALCSLPWTGIYVNTDGKIKNCAISKEVLGNIHNQTLDQILNNDINKQVRQDMLDHVRHARCDSCYQVENNAENPLENESNRTWYKKITVKHKINLDIFNDTDSFSPAILDLRWRNTCNRACVYCGPDLSSMWQNMMSMKYKIDESALNQSKKYIFDNLHTIKHVYLAGGEPLVIKENELLLKRLLEINPEVDIRINSNIGNINTPVFRLLKKFPNVKWTISVDSMNESFEYMRWPGKWTEFLINLDEIRKTADNQINFNMVWCILNSDDILDTVDLLLNRGYHENMFVVQCLTDPAALSLKNLPTHHQKKLKQKLLNRQKSTNPNYWLYKSLSSMYNFIDRTQESDNVGLASTFQFLERIDTLRNTNSRKIFQSLYQYK